MRNIEEHMQGWTPNRPNPYDKKNEDTAAKIISNYLPPNITLRAHHEERAKSKDVDAYYHMPNHDVPILIAHLEIEHSETTWRADQVWPPKWKNVSIPQRKVRKYDRRHNAFTTPPISDQLDKTLFIKFNQNYTSAYAVRLDHVHRFYNIVKDIKGFDNYHAGIMYRPKEDCRYHTIGLPDTMAYTRSFLEHRANLAYRFYAKFTEQRNLPFPVSYTVSDVAKMEAIQFAERQAATFRN